MVKADCSGEKFREDVQLCNVYCVCVTGGGTRSHNVSMLTNSFKLTELIPDIFYVTLFISYYYYSGLTPRIYSALAANEKLPPIIIPPQRNFFLFDFF
jgi:hypothetical protein